MRIKTFIILICGFFLSVPCLALTQFPVGQCRLEGYIFRETKGGAFYLFVNHSTQGETRFKLNGMLPTDLSKYEKLAVVIDVAIPKETFSEYGEVNFVKLERVLDPFTPPQIYNRESEVKAHCTPRDPSSTRGNSVTSKRKTKN